MFCFVKGSYDCKMWPPEAVDCYFIRYVINFIGFQKLYHSIIRTIYKILVLDIFSLSIFYFIKDSYDCKIWPPEAVDCYFISYLINFIGFQKLNHSIIRTIYLIVVVDCIGLCMFCLVKESYDCKMWPPEAVDCYFISYVIKSISLQ